MKPKKELTIEERVERLENAVTTIYRKLYELEKK